MKGNKRGPMPRRQLSNKMLSLLSRSIPKPTKMNLNTPLAVRMAYDVYFDGTLQEQCCTEADSEAGYVIRYVFDENGKHIIEGDGKDRQAKKEKVFGLVEFKLKK